MVYRYIWLMLVFVALSVASCKKWEDTPAQADPRLTRPYCNDPDAVNYNWDFPGVPDNSTCFFPTEVFDGRYRFVDSIYTTDYEFDTFYVYDLLLQRQSKTKFTVSGFCPGSALNFTADRFYKATADSLYLGDSAISKGQIACRPTDTLSGTIVKDMKDSTQLRISFTVYADTATRLHIGTAIKQ